MRKIEDSLRREVESYQRCGHTLSSALRAIRQTNRRGIEPLLNKLFENADSSAA